MAAEQPIRPMELEGSLKAFKFPEILQFLAMGNMTGVLTLDRDDRSVALTFRDGKITGALSDDRFMRLGQMLVYSGRISRQALDNILEMQKNHPQPKRLGELLVENGLINVEQQRAAVRLQIEEEVWDLFSWEDGNFQFEQGAIDPSDSLQIMLDVEPLLLEASHRMDEWQVICSNIEDPGEVYMVNPDLEGRPEQPLEMGAWRVLSLVNGLLSVEAIVRISGMGKFETYYALDALLGAGLIVPADPMQDLELKTAERELSQYADRCGLGRSAINEQEANEDVNNRPIFGGLFGRKKSDSDSERPRTENKAPTGTSMEFLTDIGLVCSAINDLMDRLAGGNGRGLRGESNLTPEAKKLWRETQLHYPKADMIRMSKDRLDPKLFERYIQAEGEISRPLIACHEDSLGALGKFWTTLIEQAKSETGDADAGEAAAETLKTFTQATAAIGSEEFSLAQWSHNAQ